MDSLTPEKMQHLEESGVIAKLEELDVNLIECLYDPTLADCLIRDIKDEIKVDKLRASLKATDVSNVRLQMHKQVVVMPEGHDKVDSDEDLLTTEDDDDVDPELSRLRDARMREMKAQAAVARLLALRGYGSLNDVEPPQFMEVMRSDPEGCAVCHVFISGGDSAVRGRGEELDELLSGLAHQFRGTFFARLPGSCLRPDALSRQTGWSSSSSGMGVDDRFNGSASASSSKGGSASSVSFAAAAAAFRRMATPEGPPVLLAFRGDVLVARSGIDAFTDGGASSELLEEKVIAFLKRAQVLRHDPPPPPSSFKGGRASTAAAAAAAAIIGGGGDGGIGSCSESEEEKEEDSTYGRPCEVCGRRYPHEHIRAVGPRRDEGDDDKD